MYKKLNETENTEINRTPGDLIKKVLTKLKRIIDNTPKNHAANIEENEKIVDIAEKILELNNLNSIRTRAKNTNTKSNA